MDACTVVISANSREARVAAVQSSTFSSASRLLRSMSPGHNPVETWRNRATPNVPADRGQDNVTRYTFSAPAPEAQYLCRTTRPERISVTALFSSCWWFSRQSGLYPARCRAFLRAYPVRCARRRVFSIPPFISSFFLNVSRLSPRRAFPRTFRGVDLDFCAKAERRISMGTRPESTPPERSALNP